MHFLQHFAKKFDFFHTVILEMNALKTEQIEQFSSDITS
jgi:hypothetical protein